MKLLTKKNRALLDHWASWDSYRLSQLTADAFSIRKRANDNNPWIGTFPVHVVRVMLLPEI